MPLYNITEKGECLFSLLKRQPVESCQGWSDELPQIDIVGTCNGYLLRNADAGFERQGSIR